METETSRSALLPKQNNNLQTFCSSVFPYSLLSCLLASHMSTRTCRACSDTDCYCVFQGISMKRFLILKNAFEPRRSMPQLCRVLLLALSCLVFAVMFGFPGSLLDGFRRTDACRAESISCSSKLPSVCGGEQKEDPAETSRASANTAAVWSNTQSDIAFMCLRRAR